MKKCRFCPQIENFDRIFLPKISKNFEKKFKKISKKMQKKFQKKFQKKIQKKFQKKIQQKFQEENRQPGFLENPKMTIQYKILIKNNVYSYPKFSKKLKI